MTVRDRLKRLTGDDRPPAKPDAKQAEIGELRRRIEQILERRPATGATPVKRPAPSGPPLGLDDVVRGEEHETPYGRVFVVTNELDAGVFWGRRRLREFEHVDMADLARLAGDSRVAEFAPTDALFLDTETTGLAGGTGTLAFLIGLGWYENRQFVTRLIFARDFNEETAALWLLGQFAAPRRFLVTFNGKTFDVGLLATRCVLNRLPDPVSALPHLDLLHPSRRLVGHRLDNSRLITLEQAIVGLSRDQDIPGSEIPQRYFDYLRTRDARLMAEVLEHNRCDVVTMAALTTHFAELLRLGSEAADVEADDVVAAVRLHLQWGDTARAEPLLRRLLAAPPAHSAGRHELSLICKRADRWDEAVALWREALADDARDWFAVEEMAKWLEHRAHELAEAAALVQRALEDLALTDDAQRGAFAYRLARLQRKLAGK
jgi:uncharacterized protein YprB with RNaseH-like and TPR domain